MGRAIVRNPQVFLFDEPLSNLDARLRVVMRSEIKELHQRLGTTPVYVTHDQAGAITCGIRPEHFLRDAGGLDCEVAVVEPTGSETLVITRLNGQSITAVF